MTNADKYLKDGVDVEEFIDEIKHIKQVIDWKGEPALFVCYIKDWLNTPLKPTLTEDEKVILMNIREYKWIGRDNDGDLYLQNNCGLYINSVFGHLFQFIQPRRRI